jgi:hypothetical protein
MIACDRTDVPVILTLSSEFSRQTTEGSCAGGYGFNGLAPAMYELFATYADGLGSGFAERFIGQNTQMPMQLVTTHPSSIEVINATTRAPLRIPVKLIGRRDDLSGAEPPREFLPPSARLSAGYWEFMAVVAPPYYVTSVGTDGGDLRRTRRATRPFEWFGVYVEPRHGSDRVRINVSEGAATLSGVVTDEGKAAPGIPVFLWPVKDDVRRMLGGPQQVLSDVVGQYRFTGLPPGEYRLLATMDVREMSFEVAEEAQAKVIQISNGQSVQASVPIWLAP